MAMQAASATSAAAAGFLPPEPEIFAGFAKKQKWRILAICPQKFTWTQRFFTLIEGCLKWSTQDTSLDDVLMLPDWAAGRSIIDFALTPCEAAVVEGSESQIAINPVSGQFWSKQDQHGRAGTHQVLLLDVKGSEKSVDFWLELLRKHIAFGQARRHGPKDIETVLRSSVVEQGPASEPCPICLDSFCGSGSGGREVVRTACGHHFHRDCCATWLSKSTSCPVCRRALAQRADEFRPRKPRAVLCPPSVPWITVR